MGSEMCIRDRLYSRQEKILEITKNTGFTLDNISGICAGSGAHIGKSIDGIYDEQSHLQEFIEARIYKIRRSDVGFA